MRIYVAILLFLVSLDLMGTHLRGGQITTRLINCNTRTYEVTLTLYLNSGTPTDAGGGNLTFGDGGSMLVPMLSSTLIDLTNRVSSAVFITNYSYQTDNGFKISYLELNRNLGVLNFQNSVNAPFYIESFLQVNPTCTAPLSFTIPPIDRACSKLIFTHNPGAIAPLGDSLSYQLVVPLQAQNIPVTNYKDPNGREFYSGTYELSNESGNGPPTFFIDNDGTLQWNAPGLTGEYATAIKVSHWAKINGKWAVVDWVIRDMQIIVQDCNASRPTFELSDQCMVAGEQLNQTVLIKDKVSKTVKVELFVTDNFYNSQPLFVNLDKIQSSAAPYDTANLKIDWPVGCDVVRSVPYRFIFKISSFTATGIRISTFKVWNVKVSGPPPLFKPASLDVSKKRLTLNWNGYNCANSNTIEVWRRVDKTNSFSDRCIQGIPLSLGFVKIGESNTGAFLDNDISAGATYCYRLVANFNQPYSGKSLASVDFCIGPIAIDAPVLITASVQKTNSTSGAVSLEWLSPFQINKSLFPKPYEYDLLRTKDGIVFKKINAKRLTDTTYLDANLNTRDSVYGYKVVLYSPQSIAQNNPLDTSKVAFFPRLDFKPLEGAIKLSWKAKAPWSNRSFRFPYHRIYRRKIDNPVFQLMDSVDVRTLEIEDFEYIDNGKVPGFPLGSNFIYQYKVETSGSYGNQLIKEPLRSLSNETVAQSIDKDPPCAPTLKVSALNCEALSSLACSIDTYKNTLIWSVDSGCGNDIAYYRVYYFQNEKSDSVLLATTGSNVFEDVKEYTQAGCYQVQAIDRSGNIGLPSDFICIENCLNPFIPNVITANQDNQNEQFPGFSNRSDKRDPAGCPRFIEKFSLTILNRWGDQVYQVNNSSPQVTFEWRGLDNNGMELPTGTYYYSTDITFYSSNSQAKKKNIKGWVQLIR